jgi:hypothetical protein
MQASELAFLRGCTLAGGAKNYQLWNHRRRVALQLGALDVSEVLHFLLELHIRRTAVDTPAHPDCCCNSRGCRGAALQLTWL